MEYNRYYDKNKGKYNMLLPTFIFLIFTIIIVSITFFNWDLCLENKSRMWMMLGAIAFSFFLFSICLISQIHMLLLIRKEKRISKNGFRTKGRVYKVVMADSTTLKSGKNYMKYSSLHFLIIEYIDENGHPQRYKSPIKYSKLESYYLIYKGQVDIICKGGICTVIENMDNLYENETDKVIEFIKKYDSNKKVFKLEDVEFFNPDKMPAKIVNFIELIFHFVGSLILLAVIPMMVRVMIDGDFTVKIVMLVFISPLVIYAIVNPIKAIKRFKASIRGKSIYALSFNLEPYRAVHNGESSGMNLYVNFQYEVDGKLCEGRAMVQDAYYEILSTVEKLPLKVYKGMVAIDYDRIPNL